MAGRYRTSGMRVGAPLDPGRRRAAWWCAGAEGDDVWIGRRVGGGDGALAAAEQREVAVPVVLTLLVCVAARACVVDGDNRYRLNL